MTTGVDDSTGQEGGRSVRDTGNKNTDFDTLSFAVDLTWCRPGEIGGIEVSVRNLLEGLQDLPEWKGGEKKEQGQLNEEDSGNQRKGKKQEHRPPKHWRCLLLVTGKNRDTFRHLTEQDPRYSMMEVPGNFSSAAARILTLQRKRRWIRGQVLAWAANDGMERIRQSKEENKEEAQERVKTVRSGKARNSCKGGPVVLLEPGGYHTFFGSCPGIRYVTVIHDLQPLDLPENFNAIARIGKRILLQNTFRHADTIIGVSDFTKNRILHYAPETKDHLIRIYNPIMLHETEQSWEMEKTDVQWIPEEGERTAEKNERSGEGIALEKDILSRYQMEPGSYYLTVSSLLPHKNLDTLLRVFAILKERNQKEEEESLCPWQKAETEKSNRKENPLPCRLVITGITQDPKGRNRKRLEEAIQKNHLESCVTLTGKIPEAERNQLIRSSRAILFSSVYEGFGMPCAEAALLGADLIASRITAIPEAAGEKAVYVSDPKDPIAWIQTMEEMERQRRKEVTETAKETKQQNGRLETGRKEQDANPFDHLYIARKYLECIWLTTAEGSEDT